MKKRHKTRNYRREGWIKEHPLYSSWNGMIQRCLNPNTPMYSRYGGIGIKIAKRWMKFENFIFDMGEKPSIRHSLDRIDNNKGYGPSNCRWSTSVQQANNTSKNVFLEYKGMRKTLAEWSVHLGINRNTVKKRYRRGMSVENILSTKLMNRRCAHTGRFLKTQ